MELAREMAGYTDLDPTNISAKVTNYKSVAGVIRHSNASKNIVEIYEKYGHLSVGELEKMVN